MHWVVLVLILISSLFTASLSFDVFDAEYVPQLPKVGASRLLTFVDDQMSSKDALSYLRPDHRANTKLKGEDVIPYPRIGRMTDEQLLTLLFPDIHLCNLETDLESPAVQSSSPLVRTRRSAAEEESPKEEEDTADRHKLASRLLEELEYLEPSLYSRQSRRPSSRSRNSFVPRVGKRVFEEEEEEEIEESKRAKAFTPRIGRASLIPRIGRVDPRFKVKSRGAFIPRIGRRAILTPRIGRSQDHHEDSKSD